MKKFLSFIALVVLMSCSVSFSSSALTVSDTYSDVASTSSQANNLVNYAMSYDTFISSDFVIFTDVQYSYYIVWSDELHYDGLTVSGSDIEYIRYYRTGSASSYTYVYGTDTAFSLTSSYVCTSNLAEFGFKSALYDEYRFRNEMTLLFILIGSFGFVMMILSLRGSKS